MGRRDSGVGHLWAKGGLCSVDDAATRLFWDGPLFSQSELKQEIDGWWRGVAMGTGARVRGTMIDGHGMAIAALLGARKRI